MIYGLKHHVWIEPITELLAFLCVSRHYSSPSVFEGRRKCFPSFYITTLNRFLLSAHTFIVYGLRDLLFCCMQPFPENWKWNTLALASSGESVGPLIKINFREMNFLFLSDYKMRDANKARENGDKLNSRIKLSSVATWNKFESDHPTNCQTPRYSRGDRSFWMFDFTKRSD